jgi:hypothetical protein
MAEKLDTNLSSLHGAKLPSGATIQITVHSADSSGRDRTGIVGAGDMPKIHITRSKEKSKEKKGDGQRKDDRSESQKLKDHVVESVGAKRQHLKAAPGDFEADDEIDLMFGEDSMTDFSQGRKFTPKKSGAEQRKSKKENEND